VTESRLCAAIGILAVAGAGIAAYLTYTRYSGAPIACATGGCETVQNSDYAEVIGIPVAVLGLGAWIAILVLALVPGPTAAAAGAGLALVAVLFSAWLLYAQLVLVDAVCQWCIANDVVVTLVALASLLRLRAAKSPRRPLRQSPEEVQRSPRWRRAFPT
jgi:uncharacterized membrane protein